MALKILRAQQGPDEVNEKKRRNGAASDEIEHHTRSQAGT